MMMAVVIVVVILVAVGAYFYVARAKGGTQTIEAPKPSAPAPPAREPAKEERKPVFFKRYTPD